MIRAGIIGATGYAGAEILRILAVHPNVEVKWIGSRSYADQKIASVYGNLFHVVDLSLINDDTEQMKKEILEALHDDVLARYGLDVYAVTFSSIAVPERTATAIAARMKQERETEAAKKRDEGKAVA